MTYLFNPSFTYKTFTLCLSFLNTLSGETQMSVSPIFACYVERKGQLNGNMMHPEREVLEQRGYLVLPAFMAPDVLAALRERTEELFEAEGDNAGAEFRQEPGSRRL